MRSFTACMFSVALAVGGAWAAQAVTPPLRLCADPANLPFSSNETDAVARGTPGLYVEIGQAVAEALGRPMETVWSHSHFGKRNVRTTLLAGQCDLVVGLPAVPDFMGPRVVYTRPMLNLGYALVVPKERAIRGVDDLQGQRVAVQFGSPPQSLLATRDGITSVTTMSPEEAMRRLAAGEVDAAFIWGPSAGYINHASLRDAYKVVSVDAPQLQWQAAIGFSNKQTALRDEVDDVLERLEPRIRELSAKYAVAAGPAVTMTDGGPLQAAPAAMPLPPAAAETEQAARAGDAAHGKALFDGTCAHCHGPNAVVAERRINLRLLKRKYGEQMEEVFLATVTNGRPTKGMPTWKDVFKPTDFADILGWLKTVQDE
jgi:ABC-type amino acid transport substrate-binding protein